MSRQLTVAKAACGAAGWPHSIGMDDASSGAEQLATPDCHAIEALPPFVYSTESVPFDVIPHWPAAGRPHDGCKCTAKRTKFCGETCGCNRGRSECGYGCVCVVDARSCVNRKMQRGLRKQLSLRHCGAGKGWGVFAAESIRAGDFVIEYVGEIISEEEYERREKVCNESWAYVFTLNQAKGASSKPGEAAYIDAYQVRNLAAFINFGCTPNLEARAMQSLSGDKRLPRIGFYAKSDICPGAELCYRRDASAFTRSSWSDLPCRCQSDMCRGHL